MSRDLFINGESLVLVKGMAGSAIAQLSELGLADSPIRITPDFRHLDVNANAWGEAPFECQWMLATVNVNMNLVNVDIAALRECLRLSMGAPAAFGRLARAGTRMGNGVARFEPGNKFIGLNIASPVAQLPWRFYFAYMTGPPVEIPLGSERSLFNCNWRVVPYTPDPYGGGTGAQDYILFDNVLDT